MKRELVFPISTRIQINRWVTMSEERKHAILFAATLLSARKLIEMDPDKPNMAKGYFVDKAIDDAVFILKRIDKKWPTIDNLSTC
jgi:hypothetical protein